MTDTWQPVSSRPLQAVAIFNYNVTGIQNSSAKDDNVRQKTKRKLSSKMSPGIQNSSAKDDNVRQKNARVYEPWLKLKTTV
jgi:hypothetical protein